MKEILSGISIEPEQPAKYLCVVLHGFGQSGAFSYQRIAKPLSQFLPDTYFFCPHAPNKSKQFPQGYDWLRVDAEWNDQNIIKSYLETEEKLRECIEELLEKLDLTYQELILAGFSQGAAIALHYALRSSRCCHACISFSGQLRLWKWQKSTLSSRPQIVMIHGKLDAIIPVEKSVETAKILRAQKVSVEQRIFPDCAHLVPRDCFKWLGEFIYNLKRT